MQAAHRPLRRACAVVRGEFASEINDLDGIILARFIFNKLDAEHAHEFDDGVVRLAQRRHIGERNPPYRRGAR